MWRRHILKTLSDSRRLCAGQLKRLKNMAPADSNILLTGQSGTGKELFAQSIHNQRQKKAVHL